MADQYQYQPPFRKEKDWISKPFNLFIDVQLVAGLILLFCIFLSLLLINIPFISGYYQQFIHFKFLFCLWDYQIAFDLKELVDEFLLLFFFLVLGLEIKREIIVGELKEVKKTLLILFAALGGIIFPLIFYIILNTSNEVYLHGWALPTATDTAIAIGIMSLFKNRLPGGVFPFITSVAILDDIVAITIIAVFYGENFHPVYLCFALGIFIFMLLFNWLGFRNFLIYFLPGLLLWFTFEKAGIHGAIVGVLIASTVPARPKKQPLIFLNRIKKLVSKFEETHDQSQHILKGEQDSEILQKVIVESEKATVPLKRLEFKLEKPVLFFVLPLFALTNGAVNLNVDILLDAFHSTLFWGIFIGLIFGKPIGISLCTFIGVITGIGRLPTDVKLVEVLSISLFAGIGYTMAIFIAGLAFDDESMLNLAKLSIVISSIAAGLMASFIIVLKGFFSKTK